jgi:ABC-type Na+ efflux pump permease subunit
MLVTVVFAAAPWGMGGSSGVMGGSMRLGGILVLIYVLVGVLVAFSQDYFTGLRQAADYLEALVAIVIWPVVLIGFDINIGGGPRRN